MSWVWMCVVHVMGRLGWVKLWIKINRVWDTRHFTNHTQIHNIVLGVGEGKAEIRKTTHNFIDLSRVLGTSYQYCLTFRSAYDDGAKSSTVFTSKAKKCSSKREVNVREESWHVDDLSRLHNWLNFKVANNNFDEF